MVAPTLLVAGAGPVGVVAALAAVRAGFEVQLIDAAPEIDTNPRAATTHPSTLEMIASVGLIDRFTAEGLVARDFQFWDLPAHAKVCTFDHSLLRNDTPYPYVVQTEQHKLACMGIEQLEAQGVPVRFGTAVTSVSQDGDGVSVTVAGPGGPEQIHADWMIGADGGRSTVRKQLGVEFEGFTWPERFLVLTVMDDFAAVMGCCFRNYLAAPGEWANLFKVSGNDGLGRWRAVFPTGVDETDDQALHDDTAQERLHRVHALGSDYRIVHRNIYRVHQRVAARFRVGRVLLAGDAAHVNNPIGGLGLNFGIHDAIHAVKALRAVAMDGTDDAELDRYSSRRRDLNVEFVQEQTVANKKRLEEPDEGARRTSLDALRATANDPVRARQFLLKSSLIDSVRKAAA